MDLFELGDCFRHVASFSECGTFEDLDGDGRFEVSILDWTYEIWGGGWRLAAPSPPTVIWRYDPNWDQYRLAEDLMYRSAPSEAAYTALITAIHEAPGVGPEGGNPPTLLWDTMIELIYSGHKEMAWAVFDSAWLPRFGNKGIWKHDFQKQLAESHYGKRLYPFQFPPNNPTQYPERVWKKPIYPPKERQTLPVEIAYDVPCGSFFACDMKRCAAQTYVEEYGANVFSVYSTAKEKPIHLIVVPIYEGQPKRYDIFFEADDSKYLDASCDPGTTVLVIHKSSRLASP